ncbi:MAG: PQQ-binding-like beta-propeller repeat protein [Planctomycetota bacterium]|jgi:outer membrane protein assembly factor BamB|nr:PQQ-binding-like beta-propeller repeat protein [Planctomycetota bacterium]
MKCIQLIPILTLALPLCLAENYEKGLVVTPRKAELQIKRGNEVLATARAGDKLTILRSKGTWVGVEFGNKRGWVKAADVRPLAKPASQTPRVATAQASSAVAKGDWPYYRGPNFNGIIDEELTLLTEPEKIWETEVPCVGWSSLTISKGRAYTFGRKGGIFCLDAKTGKQIWNHATNSHSGESTPVIAADRVFLLSQTEHPIAWSFDAATGKVIWKKDLPASTQTRNWGHSGSPRVWQDLVFFSAGHGVALRQTDGETVWSHEGFSGMATPVVFDWKGRPSVALFVGQKMIARDARTGSQLFEIPWKTKHGVNACDPIFFDNRVFLCSGYGLGRALCDENPKELWNILKESGGGHSYSTGIYHQRTLVAFTGWGLRVLNTEDGKAMKGFGNAQTVLLVGDKLILLDGEGKLQAGVFSTTGFTPTLNGTILSGQVWNVPAYSNGHLYARNKKGTVVCYRIGNVN